MTVWPLGHSSWLHRAEHTLVSSCCNTAQLSVVVWAPHFSESGILKHFSLRTSWVKVKNCSLTQGSFPFYRLYVKRYLLYQKEGRMLSPLTWAWTAICESPIFLNNSNSSRAVQWAGNALTGDGWNLHVRAVGYNVTFRLWKTAAHWEVKVKTASQLNDRTVDLGGGFWTTFG